MQEQQPLIDALLPYFLGDEFDSQFESWTTHLNRNQKFLLKMELNRRHTPCVRRLDLRGRTAAPCIEHHYRGQSHYLDEQALEIFEQQLQIYGGHYTEGVHEAVLRILREHQQTAPTPQQVPDTEALPSIEVLDFADMTSRVNDRFYISQPVMLELSDGSRISGTAVDLSRGGARIRVQRRLKIHHAEPVLMHVSGWPIHGQFTVKHFEFREQATLISLCMSEPDDAFIYQVDQYLAHRRNRLGLNVDYACQVTLRKAMQFATVKGLPHLPLFICQEATGPRVRFALESGNNSHIAQSFRWGDQEHLGSLFPTSRLTRLLTEAPKDDLLLTFRVTREGQAHGYAALASELASEGLLGLFIQFGSRFKSWQVYQVRSWPVNATLAGRAAPANELDHLSFALSEALQQELAGLSHIVQLTELSPQAHQGLGGRYRSSSSANALNRHRVKQTAAVKAVCYQPIDKRSEPRYRHETQVTFRWYGKKISGQMRDFSTQGMQVVLDHPLDMAVGESIQVRLPQMQKLTRQLKLNQLPYSVRFVGKGGTLLGLAVDKQLAPHPGEAFFRQLIAQHEDKLISQPTRKELEPLAEALGNIYASSMPYLVGYLNRMGNGITIARLGIADDVPNELGPMDAQSPGTYTRPAWLNAELLHKYLNACYRSMQVRKRPQSLLLKAAPGKLTFGKHTLADAPLQDQVSAVQVAMYPAASDSFMVDKELAFIGSQAMHRAKELEEELDNLLGVVDFLPVNLEPILASLETQEPTVQSA